ncbi:hypothetical protein OUZ56_030729 [Daphnia magna]|uniref:Uncharacterized protein n=1 Tax=Daphnia magna TaxID=35525 RepID=A0ABQ9ZS58_9CRUS|nr:hypothetical protein OUZ56_030729 [Daphnia magna]
MVCVEDTEEIAAGQVLSWLLAQGAHHDWTPCYHVTSCPLFPPNIQKTRQSELRETSTRRPNN